MGSSLEAFGHYSTLLSSPSITIDRVAEERPDVVLVDIAAVTNADLKELVASCKETGQTLVVGLLNPEHLNGYDPALGLDDFVLPPHDPLEVASRLKQLLWRTRGWDDQEVLRVAELIVDLSRYEVSLAGRRIDLTFKEYELLKCLASDPGRVFTRESLLQRVWGYDYFGGTRTVDVHIRRLRSKIEDSKHVFIDTVRNVGYRFRK